MMLSKVYHQNKVSFHCTNLVPCLCQHWFQKKNILPISASACKISKANISATLQSHIFSQSCWGHRLLVNLTSFPLKSGTGKLFCLTLFNPSAATSCVLPFCLVSKTRVSGKIHAQTGGCQGALTVAVAVSDTRHTRSGCPQSKERMLCCLESLFRG